MEKDTQIIHMSSVPTNNKEYVWIDIEIPEGYKLDKENSTLDHIVFKKKDTLPKTWEEFCKTHPLGNNEYYTLTNGTLVSSQDKIRDTCERLPNCDENVWPNRTYAEASLALCKLIQLRDCYNDGWMPDWSNSEIDKFVIYFYGNEISIGVGMRVTSILSFKTAELRDKFLENFRDLIEQAKPFL